MRVQSLGQEDPLEEKTATHSSILPGKFHGQRSLAGYSPQDCKESDATQLLSTRHNTHMPINYEMAMISILATSHRLPSSKHTYLPTCCTHHCPSRKSALRSCRQEFNLKRCRDSLCNGRDCSRDAESDQSGSAFLLMSRGVWRCSCLVSGW